MIITWMPVHDLALGNFNPWFTQVRNSWNNCLAILLIVVQVLSCCLASYTCYHGIDDIRS